MERRELKTGKIGKVSLSRPKFKKICSTEEEEEEKEKEEEKRRRKKKKKTTVVAVRTIPSPTVRTLESWVRIPLATSEHSRVLASFLPYILTL